MWTLLLLALLQSALLALGQVALKLALSSFPPLEWSWRCAASILTNGWFAACGLCFGTASLLWTYMVKHFPLSAAYPLLSLSYVMGLLAAAFIFHEHIPLTRWIGVALILMGVFLVAR